MMRSLARISGIALALTVSLPSYADWSEGEQGRGFGASYYHHDAFSSIEKAPNGVSIGGVTFSGEGCLDAAATISPDSQAIGIIFPNFFVSYFATSHPGFGSDRSSCQASIQMNVPAGYQFALVSGTASGQAILDENTSGHVNVRWGFHLLNSLPGRSNLRIDGAYAGSYTHSFQMPTDAASWSSCTSEQRDLVVNTVLSVRTMGAATAIMTVDAADYEMNNEYGIVWRRCGDVTKAVVAVCRAQFAADAKMFEVQGHSKATTEAEAIFRAQERANHRCENRSHYVGGSTCSVPANSCRIQEI